MKTLLLKISDRVFSEWQSSLSVKYITGNMYGTLDAINAKIIEALKDGLNELELKFKDEKNEKRN